MHDFKEITISNFEDKKIDCIYEDLLDKKYQFMILNLNNKKYVLTKERSLFEIKDKHAFLDRIKRDVYYKTIIKQTNVEVIQEDLNIFKQYLNKYKNKMSKVYGDKYYFGCVAVKMDKGFITTIRGKENFDEYTIVKYVDHTNHIIEVVNKKASLNAPLLDHLFKNEKVKTIVHLHEFDDELPTHEYAFPGSVADSIRDNRTSFNIGHHGVIYLFDKNGQVL